MIRVAIACAFLFGCGRIGFDAAADGQPVTTPGFRKQLTVVGTQVAGNLASFEVLVDLVDPDLRSIANGGFATNVDDVAFADGDATPLDFEVEARDLSTGAITAWVRIPELVALVDHPFYIYVGDPDATPRSHDAAAATWDSRYAAVWHLGEDPAGTAPQWHDSTTNGNDCSATLVVAGAGQIAGGSTWDSMNPTEIGTCGHAASVTSLFAGGGTISAWFFASDWGANMLGRIVDTASDDFTTDGGYELQVDETITNVHSIEFDHGLTLSRGVWDTPPNTVTLAAWHYLVISYDDSLGSNTPIIWIDAINQSLTESVTASGTALAEPDVVKLGNSFTLDRGFGGTLDELRMFHGMRDDLWVATTWDNQQSPSAFVHVGGLEPLGM